MKTHAHYIPQTVSLNDSSIMENIAYGIEFDDIDINAVNHAIKSASLEEYVESLPNGIYSLVGENGESLSGGQRQRIALARAFYHNREILVLDESTSALDEQTEKEIINEVNLLKDVKTIIIISHNPKILSICDKVFQLDSGNLKILN
jgi:ABC-type multidrug transport system fused ATPase/permease subunit